GQRSAAASRRALVWRFTLAGATAGFLAGVAEAALLAFVPRATGLLRPDVHYVIGFIAPLVDLLTGALLGLILGSLAVLPRRRAPAWLAALAAVGLGIIIAYVAWMLNWFTNAIPPERNAVVFPLVCFAVAAAACFCLIFFSGRRRRRFFSGTQTLPAARWAIACGIIVAVLSGGIVFYSVHRPPYYAPVQALDAPGASNGQRSPNIALIVLDTVRADHLSCYGYSRPTTPNLDRLAARGVRFENAIAPSSWTLPSLAAIFTGLLPHQSGADWGSAIGRGPWTLAKILQSKGYETAGFNANPFYGLAGWRLDEGFDTYVDESYSVRHNLAVTFVGQSALHALYNRLVRYNQFDHRTAADVNRDVVRWEKHRDRTRPFFLFINYMDAHRPYLPPSPYDRRFGKMSGSLLATVSASLKDGHPPRPYSAKEQNELIGGYDNGLAYLDDQLGRLIGFLRQQPGGDQTIFIVTADHGEGFGEHGTYDHGWNLYNEVLRVPLIIAGPGIPQGVVIPRQASIRRLFSTVLDLALGLPGPIKQTSLRQYWESQSKPVNSMAEAVSELAVFSPRKPLAASLSLMTPHWHLIENEGGELQLYDEQRDPQEQHNLAGEPDTRGTLAALQESLESRIAYSTLPWRDVRYLDPLNRMGATFVEQITANQMHLIPEEPAAGGAQAFFSHQPPAQLLQPSPRDQDLLRTLPYH
ncbi:MAG: sulfatase, partial [Terriglobia bacterium]